jgi:hypothetical protein
LGAAVHAITDVCVNWIALHQSHGSPMSALGH